MKTSQEFYQWCNLQVQGAIELANENTQIIEEINKTNLPSAQYFETADGYLEAPGFTSKVLFERAVSNIGYNKGMTTLQNEGKLYQ